MLYPLSSGERVRVRGFWHHATLTPALSLRERGKDL